jgi:hypothetical protein
MQRQLFASCRAVHDRARYAGCECRIGAILALCVSWQRLERRAPVAAFPGPAVSTVTIRANRGKLMQDPPAEQASKIRRDEIAAARAFVTDHGIEHIKVGVFELDGILRGKYLARDKFLSALDKGLGVCDVLSPQETARDDN